MEDINGEFGQADVAIILGANDVVNPAAHVKGSPIYGMPILEAYKAKTVIVNKRSMASGYAGLDNELFYMDKTMMVFGDAKKVVEDMVKAVDKYHTCANEPQNTVETTLELEIKNGSGRTLAGCVPVQAGQGGNGIGPWYAGMRQGGRRARCA